MTLGKVSIIIPCYKSEFFVDRCIESLFAQTYQNWEAIFIDDNASSIMIDKMRKYEDKDARIRYLTWWRKRTPAAARNYGLEWATGDFIAFLDADDWWEPEKLTFLMEHINIPACHLFPYVDWITHYSYREYSPMYREEDTVYPGRDPAIGGTGTILIRKTVIDYLVRKYGYAFDERMSRNDDADFILRIRHLPSRMIPLFLSHQSMRPGSLTSTVSVWENRRIIWNMCIRNEAFDILAYHVKDWIMEPVVKFKKRVLG